MELKFKISGEYAVVTISSNRTFMELKYWRNSVNPDNVEF